VMIEGRRRQIRRIATILGFPVKKLVRTHIGKLGLGTLRRGMWYRLGAEEVDAMLEPADELKFIRRKNKKFHGRDVFKDDDQ
jgi:16S rRNA U516 pseudouridylate synthase RsuA-like enzyme